MNFGDLNIPSSRAFWDDCDEDEFGNAVEQKFEPLRLAYEDGQSEEPTASDLLLLIEGPNIGEFVEHSLLRGATKICTIPAAKRSSLQQVSPRVLVAVLEDDLTNSGEVSELLLPYARLAKNVVTLTIKSKVEYKSCNFAAVRETITFVRAISGNDAKLQQHIEPLETPNFIAGVAAGIASWRDNEKLPVSCYVAYTDNVLLDVMAAEPILALVQDLGLQTDATFVPKRSSNEYLYL